MTPEPVHAGADGPTVRPVQRLDRTADSTKNSCGLGLAVGEDWFGHGGAHATNMKIRTTKGLVLIRMVQHGGLPGEGGFKLRACSRTGRGNVSVDKVMTVSWQCLVELASEIGDEQTVRHPSQICRRNQHAEVFRDAQRRTIFRPRELSATLASLAESGNGTCPGDAGSGHSAVV